MAYTVRYFSSVTELINIAQWLSVTYQFKEDPERKDKWENYTLLTQMQNPGSISLTK